VAINEYVFWQNALSIHQAPMISSLAKAGHRVVVVAELPVRPERTAQGWAVEPDYGEATVVAAPDRMVRGELHDRLARGATHIFSGVRAYPETNWSLREIAGRRSELVGVWLEPWDPRGTAGLIRRAAYALAVRRIRRRIDFVLTTGKLGVGQYRSAGFDHERVFPFAYFVDDHNGEHHAARSQPSGPPTFIFVGELARRKRVDWLLRSLADVRTAQWKLHVVGDGSERENLIRLCDSLRLNKRTTWHGFLPNERARQLIRSSDFLVLPSSFDGWGAVVGEALLEGTRVIVSDRCGSHELVVSEFQGACFDGGDRASLTSTIAAEIDRGQIGATDRRRRVKWAAAALSATAGRVYLCQLTGALRAGAAPPQPPWLSASMTTSR
jgi:glycosyltransferase involved in cell wall biosynthesis